jgi:hypothetical protein
MTAARSLALRIAVTAILLRPVELGAQTPDSVSVPIDPPPLGSTITARALADLPANGSLLSLLDAMQADLIGDRVDTGGLSTGQPARMGAHGSSWTQTLFRVGEVDITDPGGGGRPLLLPGVVEWSRVDVATGVMPGDVNAPGLAITLRPRRPTPTWTRFVELIGGPASLVADTTGREAPAISRLKGFGSGTIMASGPLVTNRLGIVLAGSFVRSSTFERDDPTQLRSSLGSFFTHAVYTAGPRDEVRVVLWRQRAKGPYANRVAFGQPLATEIENSTHVQVAWEKRRRLPLTMFGGFSRRARSPDMQPTTSIVIERLRDGPPATMLYPGRGSDVIWSIGAATKPTTVRKNSVDHTVQAGAEAGASFARARASFSGLIGELVSGVPARVWSYSRPESDSRWTERHFSAYFNDRIRVSRRVTIEGGLRLESLTGSSATNSNGISWIDVLPRAGVRVELSDRAHLAAFANYTRTAHRLPLTDLAWGDRSAPIGTVYRWNASGAPHAPVPSELGTLIQRIGPGTDATNLTSIDPDLKRPHMDEMVIGLESRPIPQAVFRFSVMASRQRQLVRLVNTGVPTSTYNIVHIPDTAIDVASTDDDQLLAAYSRDPATFGQDRYLVTNLDKDEATLVGADLSGQISAERLFVIGGITASRSEGLASNIGFRPLENDIGVLGDVFVNPNARDHAQGRLFTERGYTFKAAAAYQFTPDVRAGIVARYQDGQHFARLVLMPDLAQGPDLVRAFRNGRTRFAYTMTVDARLQKAFTVGRAVLTAMLDAYNLSNQSLEIEEYALTGLQSRASTALQPPRAVHLGLRVQF